MALFLEILDGELKGTRAPIREGFVIGRREGDLTIKDSKLSGKHATIEKRPEGELWLVDAGSANKIKFDGKRLVQLKLDPGVEFILGRTPFVVIAVEDEVQGEVPTVEIPEPPPRTFWDDLRDLAERAGNAAYPPPAAVEAFSPALKLSFIRGLQTGEEWTLGYGPRDIGAESLDLPLAEVGAPALCFRLFPQANGARIQTLSTSEVRLNGAPLKEAILAEGDVIEIKHTRIRVSFHAN